MQKSKLNLKSLLGALAVVFSLMLLCPFLVSADEHSGSHAHEGHDHDESKESKESHEDHGDAHAEEDEHKHEEDESKGHSEGKKDAHGGHDDHGHDDHEDEGFLKMSWKKAEAAGVTFSKAGKARINNGVLLHGETALNADSIIHVIPRFPGTLTKVEKHLGEPVKKGDLLAVVQSNESLAPYDIKADVDGIVIEKDATLGEFVSDNNEIFVIANLNDVWVNAAVHPRDLGRVRVGLEAIITSKDTGEQYQGKIDYIRPTLSEPTRTALARVIIPNPDNKWFPGLFVTVEVALDSQIIPMGVGDEAVLLIENKPNVFVKTKNEKGIEGFEVREVVSGKSDGGTTEILGGLRAGETVATGRTFILKAELGKGAAEHSH